MHVRDRTCLVRFLTDDTTHPAEQTTRSSSKSTKVDHALDRGVAVAEAMRGAGLIAGALLSLAGETRIVVHSDAAPGVDCQWHPDGLRAAPQAV